MIHTTGRNVTSWTNSGYADPPMRAGAMYGYRIRSYKIVGSEKMYSELKYRHGGEAVAEGRGFFRVDRRQENILL